jgi:PAS domain S-box-containing protein
MSIRATFLLIATTLVLLLGCILYVMIRLIGNQQELAASETRHHESYKLAEELRQSSDDLTRMARTYVVTGDPSYEERFRRILAIRNGESPRPTEGRLINWSMLTSGSEPAADTGEAVALEELMRRMEFSEAEFAMLRGAQTDSDSLVALEDRAMAAMNGLFADAVGAFSVHGEPDPELARRILHGEEYHRAKAHIMRAIDEFLVMVEARTTREVETLRARGRRLALSAAGLMLATAGIVALASLLLQRRVLQPVSALADAAGRIREGNYSHRVSAPRKDEVGNLALAFNLMSASIESDIETRERMADKVRASEEKFRRIFETMADAYTVTRISDGCYVEANPAAARILGYPSTASLMQRRTSDLYADSSHQERLRAILMESDEFRGLEVEMLKYDGTAIPLMLNGRVVRNEDGEPTFVETNSIDLSAQKEAKAELEEARTEAEEANRAKSAFLANMSHELRTPMNAIIGYSEMLLEDAEEDGNQETASDLGKIRAAGKHLLALINDILDLSKIEAGKMDLYVESFEVGAMIDEVVSTIDTLVRKNDNELRVELDPTLGVMRADLTKVRQALFNLLSNAAKFTHEGKIGVSVAAETQGGDPWIRIAVSDSGIGIPAEKLERVFEEFSQAEGGTSRNYGGTGLGLPISRRFCQMMGGEITVESEVGEGSTFTIRLPLQMTLESETEPVTEGAIAAPVATLQNGGEKAVLVIDDDPTALDLLGRTLQGAGLRVVTASDGTEALRLAKALHPAAITLDVMMPGMDGWEVLRELKLDPETRSIPVIMVTMTDDRETGFALGATEFLTKPIAHGRLVELLARYMPEGTDRYALVVDDLSENRDMLRRALEQEGWQVGEASNGREALDSMAITLPSLILLDLMMPVMDGFEFVMRTREVKAWRAVPIVVVTAKHLTEEDRRRLNGDVAVLIERGGMERDSLLAHIRDQVDAVCRIDTPDVS